MNPALLSRRNLLRHASLWTGAVLASPLGRVWAAPAFTSDPFKLGVASGDPLPDGFIIWTRLAPEPLNPDALPPSAIEVVWEVCTDAAMMNVVAKGKAMARPEMGHSVHVDVRGLAPHREYFYRFQCGGAASPVGRSLTLPQADAEPEQMRFAFGSCSHYEQGYFAAYRDMATQNLDFILHLGDYIYESPFAKPVRHHPGPMPRTLAEYRLYHAAYKSDPYLQAAHAHCPWFFTWDDHEVANDYSKDEAQTTRDPAAFHIRKLAAYKAYYEHMPMRAVFGGAETRMYRRALFGRLADLTITDSRQYRDAIPCRIPETHQGRLVDPATCADFNDPRSMYGAAQEKWLADTLGQSGCRWNIIANSLQFSRYDQMIGPVRGVFTDGWNGYPAARKRMIDLLQRKHTPNVVSVAGDVHTFFAAKVTAHDFDDASPTVMTEFVGGSITSRGDDPDDFAKLMTENPHLIFGDTAHRGYGLCTVTKDLWRADFRAVSDVQKSDATVAPLQSFVVENGKPGPQTA